MLIHTPKSPLSSKISRPDEKPWALLCLVFVWLWPGIIDHDLWRPNEPLFYEMVKAIKNGVFIPTIFGTTYAHHAPVMESLGALFLQLFSGSIFAPYTAVRLATVFMMVIGLTCIGYAGKELAGKYHGRSVVLILIGCPGIMIFGHLMGKMPLLFASICAFIYGISISQKRVLVAGSCIGIGILGAFATDNLSSVFFLWIILWLLPISKEYRSKRYLISVIVAAVLSFPLLFIFPYLLYKAQPQTFINWLNFHSLGIFGGIKQINIGFSGFSVLKNILWFAFPSWFLAVWAIVQQKKIFPATQWLCVVWITLAAIMLSLQKDANNEQLVWLLPPLAILGATCLDNIKRGAASFLNWFGIMVFGIAGIFLWLMFVAINYGYPEFLSKLSSSINPYFKPHWNYFPMLLALSFTPIWLWLITRKNIRGRQAITNWAAGMTLIWTLSLSLFLPWFNSLKSYRYTVINMEQSLPNNLKQQFISGKKCISTNSQNLFLAWNEYSQIKFSRNKKCQYKLTNMQHNIKRSKIVWTGTRGGKKQGNIESFMLIKN